MRKIQNYYSLKRFICSTIVIMAWTVLLSFFGALIQIAKAAGSGVALPQNTGLPDNDIPTILTRLVSWLLLVFGFVAIISFVITGIMYLMGGSMTGEKKDVSGAKKQLQWSIVGVIVGLSGYIILKAVDAWLKGSSTF